MAVEEIEALEHIFCKDGEFKVHENGKLTGQRSVVSVCVSRPEMLSHFADSSIDDTVTLTLTLPPDYPDVPLAVAVACSRLCRRTCTELADTLKERAKTLVGLPAIMDLVMWLRDNWPMPQTATDVGPCSSQNATAAVCSDPATSDVCSTRDGICCRTVLMHIDHMRCKASYTRTIVDWTRQLDLVGRLIFHNGQQLIVLIVQGASHDVKECLTRLRTCNVDVDSRGRSCKERMMSVISDVNTIQQCFSDFAVVETWSSLELSQVFSVNDKLRDLYDREFLLSSTSLLGHH
jgi:hypothetical protein